MTEYKDAYETAGVILKKLTPAEMEWMRRTSHTGGFEEEAFMDAYRTWQGEDWRETPGMIFIMTEDVAQIVAQGTIDRELTDDELRAVPESVQAGLVEYEKTYAAAMVILKKLTIPERGWLLEASIGGVEERAFRDAYHTWLGEDEKEPADVIFIITEEDAQIAAKGMIGRELTEDEMHDVSKGVQAGLDDWSMVMRMAINGATGEGDGLW